MSLYFEWRKSCGCRVPCNCNTSTKSKEQKYYVTQSTEVLDIPAESSMEVMKIDIIINPLLEKVKLDSVINTEITTEKNPEFSFHIEFSLWRNNLLLTTTSYALVKQLGQEEEAKSFMNTSHLSWTDHVLTPGIYTYTVKVNRINTSEENIHHVHINDRTLNAVVFHP